jgi:hypothetical protein
MHDLVTSPHRLRQRQSARRHFRHGKRAAATRAFTGARLYLNGAVPTLAAAADSAGSNVAYVQAAARACGAEAIFDVLVVASN